MAGIIDSFKKLYGGENSKKNHLILFGIMFVYMLCSCLIDSAIGNSKSVRQNPLDFVFGIFVSAYSIQYLHNLIHNPQNEGLPRLKDISKSIYLNIIQLGLVWSAYFVIAAIAIVVIYFIAKSLIFSIILGIATLFSAIFIQYIYLAYADTLDLKKLFNLKYLFKTIKPGCGPLVLAIIKFTFISAFILLLFILIYFFSGTASLDKMLPLAKDYYLLDLITLPFFLYAFVMIWYFAFPSYLINTYIEKIKPIFIQ